MTTSVSLVKWPVTNDGFQMIDRVPNACICVRQLLLLLLLAWERRCSAPNPSPAVTRHSDWRHRWTTTVLQSYPNHCHCERVAVAQPMTAWRIIGQLKWSNERCIAGRWANERCGRPAVRQSAGAFMHRGGCTF